MGQLARAVAECQDEMILFLADYFNVEPTCHAVYEASYADWFLFPKSECLRKRVAETVQEAVDNYTKKSHHPHWVARVYERALAS